MEELSKEDLKKYVRGGCLTVGELKEFLNKYQLPSDAIVIIERVEDVYYEKHNWDVYLKRGEPFYDAERWNNDIKEGRFLDKHQYPKIKAENLTPYTKEEMKGLMTQYHPAWCCVRYNDDTDVLFIDLHY